MSNYKELKKYFTKTKLFLGPLHLLPSNFRRMIRFLVENKTSIFLGFVVHLMRLKCIVMERKNVKYLVIKIYINYLRSRKHSRKNQ